MHLFYRVFVLPLLTTLLLGGAALASAQSTPTAQPTASQSTPAGVVSNPDGVVTNANWIMRTVLPGGAIEIYPGSAPYQIEPYFANYGAMGLSRAALLTGNASYASAAWNWLTWYSAHEDKNGFVTDYTISATGTATSTGTMDSTDAYAGTFLSAVGMAYPTNPARATTILAGIHGAINAILATEDSDGLTWATPSYHVKYLMDNGEVYDGLVAAQRVLKAIGDLSEASVASSAAAHVYGGLQAMWNAGASDFDWARFPGGGQQTTNWAVLYPDALEQASAVAFHVAFGHGPSLMSTVASYQTSITNPAIDGYQPLAVIGLEAAGNATGGVAQSRAIDTYAATTNRAWPFDVAVAGQQIFGDSDSALVGA